MSTPEQNPAASIQYRTGRLVLNSPCTVGQDAFTPQGKNKFCSQCQKLVHDMSALNEDEIKALFQANGGNVCGSIKVQRPKFAPPSIQQVKQHKSLFFKKFAAAASFILLCHFGQAKSAIPTGKPEISWQALAKLDEGGLITNGTVDPTHTNTLISGTIINQDSQLVPLEIPVSIFANGKLVRIVKSENGMFTCDLGGKLKPTDVIDIVVRKTANTAKGHFENNGHGAGKATTRLADSQNLVLQIDYDFPDYPIDGGLGWIDDEE